MRVKIYKFLLALLNNKLIYLDGLFALSYDIGRKMFFIWGISYTGNMFVFDWCKSRDIALFKWRVLMNKEEVACL